MLLFSLPRRVKNQLEVWGTQKVKCIATHLPGLHELHSCRRFIWYLSIELHGFFNTQNGAFIWGMKTASSESDHYHVVIVHVTIISVHMSPGIQNTAINGHLSIVLAALVFYPNSFPSGWGELFTQLKRLLWHSPLLSAGVCACACARGYALCEEAARSLPSLCPLPDVHHKHNQDEEQSTGQASAVPRDSLHGLPNGPQPGLRV